MGVDEDADDRRQGLLDVLGYAEELKRLRRQGWVDRGVAAPESVADHSYRLALLVLLLAGEAGVDPARALTLALVHDLPEAIAGDATPFDRALAAPDVDRAALFRSRPDYSAEADRVKHDAEADAIRRIAARLPEPLRALVVDAWEEYEADATAAARLVHQADKLETWLQALEYRARQPELVIESFALGTHEAVTDPAPHDLLAAIDRRYGRAGT
ncbi:MAG TPA: HD domain-containing protein [Thermomicrobiaceae bacterium]|nr:HD domain-containing protein [Thermomicrobiaceae bacterium]